MLSSLMMKVLIVEYIIIAIVCVVENDIKLACYWGSVVLLTASIMWGMK